MEKTRMEKIQLMLDESPQDVFLQYAMAMELMALNRHLEASQYLEKILLLQYNHIASYYQLALIKWNMQLPQEAIRLATLGLQYAIEQGNLKTANEFRTLLQEMED
jgi:tetratricopeptide (TPR) repeat protein